MCEGSKPLGTPVTDALAPPAAVVAVGMADKSTGCFTLRSLENGIGPGARLVAALADDAAAGPNPAWAP